MIYIDLLPDEILDIIFQKLQPSEKIFLNKKNYYKYHYIVKNKIQPTLYESYLRVIIRFYYVFLFIEIIIEKFKYWIIYNKSIKYQNFIFTTYFSYINFLVNKYNSIKIKEQIIINLIKNNCVNKWEDKPKNLKRNQWRKI
jgi:hypothetical protein